MAERGYHESIAEMLERLSTPDPMTGCHVWLGSYNEKGYAKLRARGVTKGMSSRVARIAYELKNGPIPEGLEVDHTCRNRGCVNPDHLEAVTHQENIQRGRAYQMQNVLLCKKGHFLRTREDGTRFCHECRMEYQREWRADQRVQSGLPPAATHQGQRKFFCDKCGNPYEVLATNKDRGPRYGCRQCRQEYYRNRRKHITNG